MVSMAGYPVSSYFLFMGATYVLLIIALIVRVIVEQKEKKQIFKDGVWEVVGPRKGLWTVSLIAMIILAGVYLLPIKIGFVMFCNGMILAAIVYELVKAFKGVDVW